MNRDKKMKDMALNEADAKKNFELTDEELDSVNGGVQEIGPVICPHCGKEGKLFFYTNLHLFLAICPCSGSRFIQNSEASSYKPIEITN